MKNRVNTYLFARACLTLALVLTMGSLVRAQSAGQPQSVKPTEAKAVAEATMMERCQDMMKQKEKLAADIKDQDSQLTEKLAEMNRASVDKKTAMMAAILTRMVEQRITMDARKAKMEEMMMQTMMQHMQMGKDSSSQCPMMGMTDMKEKSPDAHTEHQQEQK